MSILVLTLHTHTYTHIHRYVDLQWQFVETIMQSPMYGMHWFYVHPNSSPRKQVPPTIRALGRNTGLAFNCEGLHVFNAAHECLAR